LKFANPDNKLTLKYKVEETGKFVTEPIDVGTYTLYIDVPDDPNFNATTVTDKDGGWTFTITPANMKAPTGVTGVAATKEHPTKGQLTGLGTDMEYRVKGSETWITATGNTVDVTLNTENGYPVDTVFEVRYKADKNHDTSSPAQVTVKAYQCVEHVYGETLVEPEILLPTNAACLRLPGTDGKAKMSKSLGNCIYLSDTSKDVAKKVKGMYTDPLHLNISDPGHLEGNCPFIYLDAFCTDEKFKRHCSEFESLQDLKDRYCAGGVGDGTVKKILISVLEEELAPIRERRKQWEQDIPGVFEILRRGSEEARAVAAETLADVRRAMRINYFDDPKLIAEQAAKYAGK